MKSPGVEFRLAAVLAAEVAAGHRERIAQLLARGGRVAPGEALRAEFDSIAAALACAADLQRELALANAGLPPEERLELRIGIHRGEVRADPLGIYGEAVDEAARLAALCEPGGVALSPAAFATARETPGLSFIDRGGFHALDASGYAVAPARLPRRRAAAAAIAAVVLAAAIAGGAELAERLRAPAERPPATVAVLPFAEASGDPVRLALSRGLGKDIAGALGRFSAVRLQASESPEVRYLVRGRLEHADGDELIRVELRDAASGVILWSAEYAGEAAELPEIRNHIVADLAGALGAR